MRGAGFFANDYAQARETFLRAAYRAGAATREFAHPSRGPDGGALATDVAWVGRHDAEDVVVVISGTHGVEGFCGSGIQVGWLDALHRSGPIGSAASLLIHAINPYGFAWLRRVTQEGVDLNRNFVDPQRPAPENPLYDEVADALVPPSLTGEIGKAADEQLAAVRQRVGELTFARTIAGGQYRHSRGLFYGGGGPTWSNVTTHQIIGDFLAGRTRVVVLDLHTGLGPYGYGELLINHAADSAGAERALAFWGESVATSLTGQTIPFVTDGPTHYGYNRALAHTEITFATVEFGTFDRATGRQALRADHWLHAYGDPLGPEAGPIRTAMRRQFFPDTADWKEAVLFRGRQVIRMAAAGLAGARAERA